MTNQALEDQVVKLTMKLEQAEVQLKKFTVGTSHLDKMLQIGQSDSNKKVWVSRILHQFPQSQKGWYSSQLLRVSLLYPTPLVR